MVKSRSRIYPLLTEEQIQRRVKELGAQITADYEGKDLVVIGLLNGVYPFFADLTRAIDLDLDVNFMRVASYGNGMESTGEVKILTDMDKSIRGRHALVIEDIVDTGLTLHKVRNLLLDREPASLRIVHPPGQAHPAPGERPGGLRGLRHRRPLRGGLRPGPGRQPAQSPLCGHLQPRLAGCGRRWWRR